MSDSSGGNDACLSNATSSQMSNPPPPTTVTSQRAAGHTAYATDLSELEPLFSTSMVPTQSSSENLISLSPTKAELTPSTPSKDLLLQFDDLMLPSSTPSTSQTPLLDVDSEMMESSQGSKGNLTSSSLADIPSDTFDTPPSSPSWQTDSNHTPANISTPNPPITQSPAPVQDTDVSEMSGSITCKPLIPAPDYSSTILADIHKDDTLASDVSHISEPFDSAFVTAPIPDNVGVQQEFATHISDNSNNHPAPTETSDQPSEVSPTSHTDTNPHRRGSYTNGSMLLVHGMSDSISIEKLNLHFCCYRASIHIVEIVQDPQHSDLKMGVVKFLSPGLAHKLQHEFQLLPFCGQTHKVTATVCEIPVPQVTHCPPYDSGDELESRSSIMEGAPLVRERKPRPPSPASSEFSPFDGTRADTQRGQRNRPAGRKYQRIEPQVSIDPEGHPPVHAVMIKNILKHQNTNPIKDYVYKWWGNQIASMKPVPDKNSSEHIILYFNMHSEDLPKHIVRRLEEERLVIPPMKAEVRYHTPLNTVLKKPLKPKSIVPPSQESAYSSSMGPEQYNQPPCHQDEYTHPDLMFPQDHAPCAPSAPPHPMEDRQETTLVLEHMVGPVNDETMSDYFKDFLEFTRNWDANPVQGADCVKVVFSSKRAATHAMESLAQIPFNGGKVSFSIEAPPNLSVVSQEPQAYLIITGIDNNVTVEEFEACTVLKRYRSSYSDIRVQMNKSTGEKRVRVAFHDRDVVIEAEAAMLQSKFRDRQVDAKIEHIKQIETPPKERRIAPSSQSIVPTSDCIVVVRSIPPGTSESEMADLFTQFGIITKDIELKLENQSSNFLQCRIVFDNPKSAFDAAREKDRCVYKGHFLNVKILSELIQTEHVQTEHVQMETVHTEPTEPVQTEVTPQDPLPLMIQKKVSLELMIYLKTKFEGMIDNFTKDGGCVSYDEGQQVLTINHPDPQSLLRFEENTLDQVDEILRDVNEGDMKLLSNSDSTNSTCIETICSSLKETKQIDYRINYYPNQIHIFGDKLSVSVTLKKLNQTLYSQLAIECPLMIFFKKFPSTLHPNADQIEFSDLIVRIKSTSLEQCRAIRDSMQNVITTCSHQPLDLSLKLLKPAHVFITRNDLCVCLLIRTQDGQFIDQATKDIPGASCYLCGMKEHVESLVTVLANPIEKRVPISQKALKKLTKTADKKAILLERFEMRSKVCIKLDKQTVIISGFIQEDVDRMIEELNEKFEDVSLELNEPSLEKLQKIYLLKGQTIDRNLISQIIQDLECHFQLKVEIQGDRIMLSGDQDSLLSCENNPQELTQFFSCRVPIKMFHKVVESKLADEFLNLIFKYLNDLSSQTNFFIFRVMKPQPMINRPGSSDIQIHITADVNIIALIEPKVKEIRPKSEIVKLKREDLNLVLNVASDKIKRISDSEYFLVVPDKQASRLQVLSIGMSSRSAQAMVDSALSDQNDSRDFPINAMFAFYIREKKLTESLSAQFQCILKLIEVKENANSSTCIRMDGKRDSLDSLKQRLTALDKDLTYESVEVKFPIKKFCNQFYKEILEVIASIRGESEVIIDTRALAGRGPTSINQCTLKFISTSRPDVQQLSSTFSELIKFEKSTQRALSVIQHEKLVADMLSNFAQLSMNKHYYIDLTRDNVVIMALNYFAKNAIPCGLQDIGPYLEISSCEYRPDNQVILNLLNNQPSLMKLHSLGTENSVTITPSASLDKPFKLEGKNDNVGIVLEAITKYVEELSTYLGKCEVAFHCPLMALQSDPEMNTFLSSLSAPEWNIQWEFPNQSLGSAIASFEIVLHSQTITIELHKGDITKLKVDAIVNAANDNLDHCGGVALAISNAGGLVIQRSSTDYVQQNGKVHVSDNVILPSGNLPCKSVIHSVGPIWDSTNPNKVQNELGNCVFNICQAADLASYSCIAIPAISAGIFGFPIRLSTSIIIEAIENFFSNRKTLYSLRRLILIDIQDAILQNLQTICNNNNNFRPSSNPVIAKTPIIPARRKTPPVPSTPRQIFEWQENDGAWHPYSEADHEKIRADYNANPQGTTTTSRKNYTYTIDFTSMVQTNNQTNAQRNIRLTNVTSPTSALQPAPVVAPPSTWKDIASEKISFFGPRDKLNMIEQQFTQLVAKNLFDKTNFPVTCPMQDLIPIMDSCKTTCIKFDLEESAEGFFKVLIEGFSKEVIDAERKITVELLKLLQVQNPQIEPTPKHWQPQNEVSKLVSLVPGSPEYRAVVTKFQSTLPGVAIVRVERIQSTWLWTRYQQDKQRIIQKSAAGANEMSVYHGTSRNDPVKIHKGTQGFDHRFSGGMWGTANYFAVNASYSNSGYAHTLPDGSRQLFSVKICAGDVIELGPDSSLRLPPLKNQTTVSSLQPLQPSLQICQTNIFSQISLPPHAQPPSIPPPTSSQGAVAPQFADDRYDTVSGKTGGSIVYMIYENGRAYPEYLITYR